MNEELLRFLGGRRTAALDGAELWLISAHGLLQAQREAMELAKNEPEAVGLCFNACLLARAARKNGERIFRDGADVMNRMPAEKIGFWAEKYLALCAEENPPCCAESGSRLRELLADEPYERLKWKVLSRFGVLPSEQRARDMTDGDFLYCVAQMTRGAPGNPHRPCPSRRAEGDKRRCPVGGAELASARKTGDRR
ncbi:MAG: hypothetical protein MJ118_09065, partial [Clostridia bacterium]|nr:hypothetical protein [Clostridia bacterium]